jgi:ABC-2 type transport system ATP-binding protein
MDEATRCHRVGFLRGGRLIVEGAPRDLRASLQGQILELTGAPVERLVSMIRGDRRIRSVQRFGESLHLLVHPGQSEAVLADLPALLKAGGGSVSRLAAIPPQLEDVFIALSEVGS